MRFYFYGLRRGLSPPQRRPSSLKSFMRDTDRRIATLM